VTGGAGFIGSHLVDALLARGERVVVLDDLSTGDRTRVPPAARFVKGDVRDASLSDLLKGEGVGTVFNLAAQVDVRKSVADPVGDASINVLGTVNVARAAAEAGTGQIVFSSSGGAIYGDPQGDRADEEHPLCPCSPYGAAKLAGEKYLQALAIDGGFAVTLLRYANVYGPRQDGRGEAGVIGIWMRRLLDGHEGVIFGDGLQTRDFVFVSDVVAANVAAFSRRATGTFNVGTGVETNLVELYRQTAAACGSSRPATHGPAKPGEQRRSVLDPSRAASTLDLSAWAPLEEGLRATAEWFRRQPAAG
jgi:UDP-glucose 4-epimerase